MKQYRIQANAKINLGLNVLSKRKDGYHVLDMLMFPLSWKDTIKILVYPQKGKFKLHCNDLNVPTDKRNILYKVYEAFYQKTKLNPPKLEVFLKKKIPSQAGLGGGSSDGAFFLKFLNRLHHYPLSIEEQITLGSSIGADLPFFIQNIGSRVQGIGEKMVPFLEKIEWKVICIKPPFGYSTKEVYQLYDEYSSTIKSNFEEILFEIRKKEYKNLEGKIWNGLEQALLFHKKELSKYKQEIERITKRKPFLTGSGSTYCILVEPQKAQKLKRICKKHFTDCQIKLCSFL